MAIINPDDFQKLLKTGAFGTDHIKIFGKLRSAMIADGELFDITEATQDLNLDYRSSAIMSKLFAELYPWAEDAVKGIAFDQRTYDMLKCFIKECKFSLKSFQEFDYTFESYVKEVINFDKVKTFKDGKPRTKTIRLWAAAHPGDTPDTVLTFGLRDTKWTGTRTPPLTS